MRLRLEPEKATISNRRHRPYPTTMVNFIEDCAFLGIAHVSKCDRVAYTGARLVSTGEDSCGFCGAWNDPGFTACLSGELISICH